MTLLLCAERCVGVRVQETEPGGPCLVTLLVLRLLLAPYLGKLMTKDHVVRIYMSTGRVKRDPIFVAWEISDCIAQSNVLCELVDCRVNGV